MSHLKWSLIDMWEEQVVAAIITTSVKIISNSQFVSKQDLSYSKSVQIVVATHFQMFYTASTKCHSEMHFHSAVSKAQTITS